MKRALIALCVVALLTALSVPALMAGGKPVPPPTTTYKIMANNDLGMHCTCPSFDYVTVLPPFNTFRAQVISKTGNIDATLITDNVKYQVAYSVLENTDAILKNDTYYQNWIKNAPKLFPASLGFLPPIGSDGRYQSPFTGAKLSGEMKPETTSGGWWEIAGVPVFPVVTNSSGDIMTDPLGGPNRTPYLTGQVQLIDRATNNVLATDQFTVPIAFGGCCGCHLKLAQSYGYRRPTPLQSFQVMGMLHGKNSSGVDLSYLDTDGDGAPGPLRCSYCHLDPAMGESTAPGMPAGYKILAGAKFTSTQVHPSQYTFSDVLHRFHATDSVVLSSYDPNIAKNCYDCHPGNGVNCYRDTHTTKLNANGTAIWCTDCHGDLNQRIAQKQMDKPWSDTTLPKCATCHGTNYGEGGGWLNLGIFGQFLNSSGHKQDKILCSTCHGSPHGLNPSTLALDNQQNINYQNDPRPIGVCDVCHTGKSAVWGVPPH